MRFLPPSALTPRRGLGNQLANLLLDVLLHLAPDRPLLRWTTTPSRDQILPEVVVQAHPAHRLAEFEALPQTSADFPDPQPHQGKRAHQVPVLLLRLDPE